MKRSLYTFLLLVSGILNAQSTFLRQYLGNVSGDSPWIYDLASTPDTGFILAGSNQDINMNQVPMVIKLDRNGLVQWSKQIGSGSFYDSFESVAMGTTGLIYAAGNTTSISMYGNLFLLSMNSSGVVQWTRILKLDSMSGMTSNVAVGITSNNQLAVSASAFTGSGISSVILARFSTNGALLWSRVIQDSMQNFYVTNKDLLVKSGSAMQVLTEVSGSAQGVMVAEVDLAGSLLWHKLIWNPGDFMEGCSIENTLDGGSIIGGKVTDMVQSIPQFLMIKLDVAGNIQWAKRYMDPIISPSKGSCLDVKQCADGTYLASSTIADGMNGNSYPVFLRFDSLGNFLWCKRYGVSYAYGSICSGPAETLDGKIASAFTIYDIQTNGTDGLIVKANANGGGVCLDSVINFTTNTQPWQILAPYTLLMDGRDSTVSWTSSELVYPIQTLCYTSVGTGPEWISGSGFTLSPTPAGNEIRLELSSALQNGNVTICNAVGETLHRYEALTGSDFSFNLFSCSSGLYFITVRDEGHLPITLKFIKQ